MTEDMQAIRAHLREQGKRLESIETAIRQIAVQNNQIEHLQSQTTEVWRKHDALCEKYNYLTGPGGAISQLTAFQASCPRKQLGRLWWAVGLSATLSLTSTGLAITIAAQVLGVS